LGVTIFDEFRHFMKRHSKTSLQRQHQLIRREFKRQTSAWAKQRVSADLRWVARQVPLRRDLSVLDVAAGTGLLSQTVAPKVKRVVALDVTPEMIAQGRKQIHRRGLLNISFILGRAEALPFLAGTFDLVMTRFSFHHFRGPEAVLKEMIRVCRPGGNVVVVDLLAPADHKLRARYNLLERLRDRSHTEALSQRQMESMATKLGLKMMSFSSRQVKMDLEEWLDFAHAGLGARKAIRAALQQELKGSQPTGFHPIIDKGRLAFRHTWAVLVACKPQ
jgi:ubiquinone/menaquinone biosynthesis C-methylase UbiE